MVSAQARREQVGFAVSRGLSQRRACALLSVARSALNYTSKMLEKDVPVLAAMCTLSAQYPRFGYRRVHVFLDRQGFEMGHGRALRLWQKGGMQVPRKRPRKRVASSRPRVYTPTAPCQVWAYDFVHDACANGQKLKCLTVIDEFTKVSLAIDVAGSIRSGRVVEVLSKLVSQHGAPRYFRSDNELNAIGLVQKEQTHPLTANCSQKNNSVTSTLKPVVSSTNQTGHRFTIMNTRSDSGTLRSSPNLKQSGAQWKVRTLSTGSYRPQRPHREGSIHWAKLQSNPDKGYRI